MKTSLVIMAAGMGSRFGTGIKQLSPVGPNGELIIDYSVHDAIQAGFNKIIIIIRKDIEEDFRRMIGDRLEVACNKLGVEFVYVFQSQTDIPASFSLPTERKKPLGTGQAVLSARDVIDSPFAVINADDYYGKTSYRLLHEFLISNPSKSELAMAGFVLKNTLSENGGVTRGLCRIEDDQLLEVVETRDIVRTESGAQVNGVLLDPEAIVSMNMWGMSAAFMDTIAQGFVNFLTDMKDPMKDEFLLPVLVGQLLNKRRVSVKVMKTEDRWFGVTYHADRQKVMESIQSLIAKGVYPQVLFSDLLI